MMRASIEDLRDEFMEPTFTLHTRVSTLMPVLAECVLAASSAPTITAFLEAGDRLHRSKSPLADCVNKVFLKWCWSRVDDVDVTLRWLELTK